MKVTNWKRKLAATLVAAGVWLGGAHAHAQIIDHFVGDASFDDTAVPGSGYAYWSGAPETAWESGGNWWYNTEYATVGSPKRPDPRTGDQALHGFGDYNWQVLGDTFEAGRRYTLSAYVGGDSDSEDASDRTWLYIYDGTSTPASFDGDSLVSALYDNDGSFDLFNGSGSASNDGWTIGGGNEWGLATISYTATAAVDGLPIGIAMYGRGDAAMDDVSVASIVPEPSAMILFGLGGMVGLLVLRRRKPG